MTQKSFSRRDFLRITAVGGFAALGLGFSLGLDPIVSSTHETRLLMGTIVNLTIISDDTKTARAAISACLDRMSALEEVLSRFLPKSQVSRLNQTGAVDDPPPALFGLIEKSLHLSQITNGAFDISVKPLLDLYQAMPGVLPTTEQIRIALGLVDYRNIELSERRIAFRQPGMSITVDGIAKGFIVDEGISILRQFGFVNVLAEAGGDLMALGEKSPRSLWKIGLQAPRARMGELAETFNLQNQAIATSGDYMQAFTPDFAHHHIIDPRVGHSSPDLASVSVIAPNALLADGLATAVMVLGYSGMRFIESIPDCEACAITKSLKIIKTSGL